MATHDIIDNRQERLVDHIQRILPSSARAKFAVGYFFLSGLEALGRGLDSIEELRLLIGNTTTARTIEQLAEGYRRLELVEEAAEKRRLAKRSDRKQSAERTAENLRQTVEVMDQTDGAEALVVSLARMVEQGRLKVRVYTKGRLHAKAYIFDYSQPNPGNEGIAIVGSSNLTLAGIRDNTELNVLVHDNGNPLAPGQGNHAKLTEWFETLWNESDDFAPQLMAELSQSWAARLATPYDIYMKTLYALVQDRLEGGEEKDVLWDDEITRDLADFQKTAVRLAVQMIRDNGGCFLADVVGLGKSYIGSAIVKHFERTERCRPLIICPKPLEEMWACYNELYELHAHVLPMSMLQAGERGVNLLDDIRYRDRDFVLIDESHNFRHQGIQRYEELARFLGRGQKVCLLTATPRNTRAADIYHQIKLFHPEDRTDLPIDPPDLREYFKLVERGERKLQDVLRPLIVRRRRRDVLRWYGYAADTARELRALSEAEVRPYLAGEKRAYVMVAGRHQFFPRRELETLRYSIEATYQGLYQDIRACLGKPRGARRKLEPGRELTYARYGLWHYVRPARRSLKPYSDLHRAGVNLRGLIRTMLFKRFESSVHAFRETVTRLIKAHDIFLKSLQQGFVPAGDKAEVLFGRLDTLDESDLLLALEEVSGRYDLADFDSELLAEHVRADIGLLRKILRMVEPITPAQDAKLQALKARLARPPIKDNKCLIFTQYADTAAYLHANLNPGGRQDDIEVIYGSDKSKARVVGRFAPKANPQFRPRRGEREIRILVATDVLAQGLNMQDCDVVVNYDLHWNPVLLIQRFGRIDRIGSEHDVVYGMNFLPETELERNLGIHAVLQSRIAEIHETIGEDAAILDKSEQVNEDAMYAIYEGKAGQLALFPEDDEGELVDLNEAEEFLRNLARDNPEEFRRITELRDGIRSAKASPAGRLFVFCQAGRFQQLFLMGRSGEVLSRDIPHVLAVIKSAPDEPRPDKLPDGHNEAVMKVKGLFATEVANRRTLRDRSSSLTLGQRYVLRELRVLFSRSDDEDTRAQVNILDQAFRLTPTAAVKRELNSLRRNGVIGDALLKALTTTYHEHRLGERLDAAQEGLSVEVPDFPRVICSEALL